MMKTIAAVLFVAGLSALPAQAAVVDVVITGVVRSTPGNFYDNLNLFSGNLTGGAAFTASYTYDTAVGTRGNTVNLYPADNVSGSSDDPSARGIPVQGSLTIGGVTHVMQSPSSFVFIRDNASAFLQPNYSPGGSFDFNWAGYEVRAEAYDGTFNYTQAVFGNLSFQLQAALGSLPTSLETGYTFSANPAIYGVTGQLPTLFGNWTFSTYDRSTNVGVSSYAGLLGEQVTVTVRNPDVAPVPLPAGLPLLAAALCGLALVRRRAK